MKTKFFSVIILAVLFTCKPSSTLLENEYEITVNTEGVYNGLRAYLKTTEAGSRAVTIDTSIVMNGSFKLKGIIDGSQMRALTIDGVLGKLVFILEPGEIFIEAYKDSLGASKVSGTYNNTVFEAFKTQNRIISDEIGGIRKKYLEFSNDPELQKALRKRGDSLRKVNKNFGVEFALAYPDSDFSLLLLENMTARSGFDVELISDAFENLDETMVSKNASNILIANKIKTKIEAALNVPLKIGDLAPDFTAPTPEGQQITMSKIKGKVTIIDFWASWCKPCRIENPNLVNVYNKYHDKGLEIISVALDRENKKDLWTQAIQQDQLNWYNVSNLKFWNDPIAKAYNVNSIPATFIINEKGIIIADRLRGAELETKIEKLLN